MLSALLLIGSLLQPAEKLPTLYLLIGDNHESLILESELKRIWDKPPKHCDAYQAIEHRIAALPLARERRKIRARIEFVRADRFSVGPKIPAWRIGRYGRWEGFDRRAFAFTGRPVRTVRWLMDHYHYDRWPDHRTQYRGPFVDDEIEEKEADKRTPKPPWENGQ